jgi:L-iditol 2-dehydrogenase
MKALVLSEYNRLEFKDVPEPECGTGEVLVEVKACGICGSDVHGMDGSSGRRIPPIIMGHEASGIISEVGDGVSQWHVGDRVTFDSTVYCGRCQYCLRGKVNLCSNRQVLGVSCAEFRRHGAYANYVAVPQITLCRLPEGLAFEAAAMVEPVSIAVHAVQRVPIHLNDTAVVIGTGMIGLFIVQALRLAGCGEILAVDVVPKRLELARKLGATAVLSPNDCDVTDEIFRRTGGEGTDVAFEAAGFPDTVAMAFQSVRKGGAIALVGNLSPSVELPLQAAVTRELTIYGSCASAGEYPVCLEMIARGAIDVTPLISASVPLEEGAAWFERLHRGEEGLLKVLLIP